MKKIVCAALLVAAGEFAWGEVKWTYDAETSYLTEILDEESTDTAWVFKLTDATVAKTPNQLSLVTEGTSTDLDFGAEALPDEAPEILGIASKTFYNSKLKAIVLPETLKTLGSQSFQSSKITSLTVPASVTSLGTHLLYQTSVTNVCFCEPSHITTFNVTAVFQTSTIRWINVPASVTAVGNKLGSIPYKQTVDVVFGGDMIETDTCMFQSTTGANYDYYLRVKIDRADHPLWQAYLDNPSYVTSWTNLASSVQAQFFTYFPNEPHPYGLIVQTAKGMRANSWIAEEFQAGEYAYDDGFIATMDDTVATNWVNGNLVYTFSNVNTRALGELRADMTLKQYLVVGGGGAGGCAMGGGGGGGAALLVSRDIPLAGGTSLDIAIGKGGAGGLVKGAPVTGGSGGSTRFGWGDEAVVAYGGGGGAYSVAGKQDTSYPAEGATLASGGGAAMRTPVKATSGVDFTEGYGNPGGSATYCSPGGGGGFGGAGGDGVGGEYDKSKYTATGGTAGAGGAGLVTSIRGMAETFGAGGGGGGGSFYAGGGWRTTCTNITAGTAAATAGCGGQNATGQSAAPSFGGGGGGGGSTMSSSTANVSYGGGDGGSGCVILVLSPGIASAQPEVSDLQVTFPNHCTQPQVTATLGGEGSYAATVTVSCGTGALAKAGTAFDCTRVYTSVGNGDTVGFLADFYPAAGERVYVRIEVTASGAQDVSDSVDALAEGEVPAFVGHGGDPDRIIHVRDGATGKATGRNWADAYPDFRAAIGELKAGRSELWYCGSNTLTLASSATIAPPVAALIRGGFAGTEDAADERQTDARSVVDGEDLFEPFVLANEEPLVLERFRIVRARTRALLKTGAGDLAVTNCEFDLNGRVTEGVVGRAVNVTGDGVNTRLVLSNCRLSRHYETQKTTGIPTVRVASLARAVFDGCTFVSNGFDHAQVAICVADNGTVLSARNAPLTVMGCRFLANVASIANPTADDEITVGGLVYVGSGCGGSAFTNCLWVGNESVDTSSNSKAPDRTSGMLMVRLDAADARCSVVNCTFAGNYYRRDAATAGLSVVVGTVEVANSIFYGNLARTNSGKFFGHSAVRDLRVAAGGTANVRYTLFEDDTGCLAVEGGVLNLDHILYADPCFESSVTDIAACVQSDQSKFASSRIDEIASFNAHVSSRCGYLDERTGRLVAGTVTSPAVDAGDPLSDWSQEPEVSGVGTSGRRVNLGFYGNTPWATMSRARGSFIRVR